MPDEHGAEGAGASAAEHLRALTVGEDRPVFGAWVSTPSAELLAAFAGSSLDYIGIDCQHGSADEASTARLIGGLGPGGPCRIVRVAANRGELIGRVLDGGAEGVIVPAVESAAEARRIVEAVRFPPDGVRSYGPAASFLPRDPDELGARALVLPMVETASGLAAVEEILAVPGIDGVYVGPADLGLSLGHGHMQFPAGPELEPALGRIAAAARVAGKIGGIHAGHESFARRYVELGFRLLTLGSVGSFVVAGVASVLEAAGDVDRGDSPGTASAY